MSVPIPAEAHSVHTLVHTSERKSVDFQGRLNPVCAFQTRMAAVRQDDSTATSRVDTHVLIDDADVEYASVLVEI